MTKWQERLTDSVRSTLISKLVDNVPRAFLLLVQLLVHNNLRNLHPQHQLLPPRYKKRLRLNKKGVKKIRWTRKTRLIRKKRKLRKISRQPKRNRKTNTKRSLRRPKRNCAKLKIAYASMRTRSKRWRRSVRSKWMS